MWGCDDGVCGGVTMVCVWGCDDGVCVYVHACMYVCVCLKAYTCECVRTNNMLIQVAATCTYVRIAPGVLDTFTRGIWGRHAKCSHGNTTRSNTTHLTQRRRPRPASH